MPIALVHFGQAAPVAWRMAQYEHLAAMAVLTQPDGFGQASREIGGTRRGIRLQLPQDVVLAFQFGCIGVFEHHEFAEAAATPRQHDARAGALVQGVDGAVVPFAATGVVAGRLALETLKRLVVAGNVDHRIGAGDGRRAIRTGDSAPDRLARKHSTTLRAIQRLEVHTIPGRLSEINYISEMPNYQRKRQTKKA